ncbi:uncharacterized protein LOC135220088, partial [Macrobrachium nipponense]|uniref:uncharacterized protein LOC135220088 n=1 Tax=Macrobrachium nipponense TaxID=159736 RepID=UPI0030C8A0BA
MAQRALRDGVRICNQYIPPHQVQEEIHVPMPHCGNCLSYDHHHKQCPTQHQIICINCSEVGHTANKCKNQPKCKHCNGDHPAFDRTCPVRRELRKRKGELLREKENEKAKKRNPEYNSYSEALKKSLPTNNNNQNPIVNNNPTIQIQNQAINLQLYHIYNGHIFAALQDMAHPGTYQKAIDEYYTINNLPKVKIPQMASGADIISKLAIITQTSAQAPPPNNQETPQQTNTEATNVAMEESITVPKRVAEGRESDEGEGGKTPKKAKKHSATKPKLSNLGRPMEEVEADIEEIENGMVSIIFPKKLNKEMLTNGYKIQLIDKFIQGEVNGGSTMEEETLKSILHALIAEERVPLSSINFCATDLKPLL